MLVSFLVAAASMLRRADFRIGRIHVERVFIDVVAMGEVQVPVVQVTDMVAMDDDRVAAAGAVDMIMVFVDFVIVHGVSPG